MIHAVRPYLIRVWLSEPARRIRDRAIYGFLIAPKLPVPVKVAGNENTPDTAQVPAVSSAFGPKNLPCSGPATVTCVPSAAKVPPQE